MSENTQNNNIFREIGTIAALLVLFGLMVIFVPSVQADISNRHDHRLQGYPVSADA